MTARKRPAPAQDRPIRDTISASEYIRPAARDAVLDGRLVASADDSIWQALFDGRFRLAVRCDTCGRWLTAYRSKQAGRGPRCHAKVVLDV